MTNRFRLFGLACLLCVPSAPAPAAPADPSDVTPLRRVLIISCDTLSASHLQRYGYDHGTTTVVDSLAAEGVVFRHCLAPQVWTLTSHMSMLTGLAPGVHRVGADTALPASAPLLAERLREAGFATGAFITSNSWMAPDFGFDRGFDLYRKHWLHEPIGKRAARWLGEAVPIGDASEAATPFCAFVHYMDVHTRDSGSAYPYKPFRIACWPHQRLAVEAVRAETLHAAAAAAEVELSEEQRRALKALGY